MTKKIEFTPSSKNLFEDLGFEKQEAKKMHLKAHLMASLMKYIKGYGLTQLEAAERLGITQSRMSNLANFRSDLFSTEMLLDMLERAGFQVYAKIESEIDDFLAGPWPKLTSPKASRNKSAH